MPCIYVQPLPLAGLMTPAYQIRNIQIIDINDTVFANQAVTLFTNNNGLKYHWRCFERRTRFGFCLDDGSNHCNPKNLTNRTECSGVDIVIAAGSRIRYSG